jgi:solute carrier family 8 (sodium/calcium exchanger)
MDYSELLTKINENLHKVKNEGEDFKCRFQGLFLPVGGESEMEWPNGLRLVLYFLGMLYVFLGVATISDVFMTGIEKITSSKRRVKNKETGRMVTVYVWNSTVANLTLMALGSSAPEILLSLIEICSDNFSLGPLGAGTIVGSAAFNLMMISSVCVLAIPDGEVRYIKEVPVYIVTASCSVFAYMWLMFILIPSSKDVCEVWEAVVTLLFCPILVFVAYLADRGYFSKNGEPAGGEDADKAKAIPDDVTDEELAALEQEIRNQHGATLTSEQVVKIMQAQYFSKHSRAYYRHAAMEMGLRGKKVDRSSNAPPRPQHLRGRRHLR